MLLRQARTGKGDTKCLVSRRALGSLVHQGRAVMIGIMMFEVCDHFLPPIECRGVVDLLVRGVDRVDADEEAVMMG